MRTQTTIPVVYCGAGYVIGLRVTFLTVLKSLTNSSDRHPGEWTESAKRGLCGIKTKTKVFVGVTFVSIRGLVVVRI